MKTCRKCDQLKPLSDFRAHGSRWYRNECKVCEAKTTIENRRKRRLEPSVVRQFLMLRPVR